MDPLLGPRTSVRVPVFPIHCSEYLSQGARFSDWSDWLKQQDTNFGRTPMFRNLDETAVSQARPGAVGMVVSKQTVARRGPVTMENADAWPADP